MATRGATANVCAMVAPRPLAVPSNPILAIPRSSLSVAVAHRSGVPRRPASVSLTPPPIYRERW
eukprot:79149-Alexandrium_andersonii.AAC.1